MNLAAVAGRAGSAAVGLAPAEAGVNAGSGEEPTACASHGRRRVPQEEAVHRERAQGTGGPDAGPMGQLSAAGVAAHVPRAGGGDDQTRSGSRAGREESAAGGATDDASGSGAGALAGLRADHRAGGTFPRPTSCALSESAIIKRLPHAITSLAGLAEFSRARE